MDLKSTSFLCLIVQSRPEWIIKTVSSHCTWTDVNNLEYKALNNICKCTERLLITPLWGNVIHVHNCVEETFKPFFLSTPCISLKTSPVAYCPNPQFTTLLRRNISYCMALKLAPEPFREKGFSFPGQISLPNASQPFSTRCFCNHQLLHCVNGHKPHVSIYADVSDDFNGSLKKTW